LKKSFKYLVILLVGMALVLNSCKEECPTCQDPTNPDCENYDPCYGKKTINTYFKARSGDNGFPPPPEWCLDKITYSDTFLSSSVRFTVPEGNPTSTYQWQIGSDPTVRTAKEFEISFYDELQENGWERSIPVTLTIRTPLNSCLDNPKDTFKVVTRELFFTNSRGGTAIFIDDVNKKFKGYFTSQPNEEVILETIYDKGMFRGETPPHWLIVGLPIADTLKLPELGCGLVDGCGSYTHGIVKWERTSVCSWVELTKYITERETIYNNETEEVTIKFRSTVPGHEFNVEFIGKEI
jgi:hypothetical protein